MGRVFSLARRCSLTRYFSRPHCIRKCTATYFQGWLGRVGDRESALAHAKTEAERAVRYILERGIIHR